jgi:flagellar biogenesis protein FliO
MMDTLWRLTWALPLVMTLGLGAVLILRRFGVRARSATAGSQRMNVRESLMLSADTQMHLIEIDRNVYLLVESAGHVLLQAAAQQSGEAVALSAEPAGASRWWPWSLKGGLR